MPEDPPARRQGTSGDLVIWGPVRIRLKAAQAGEPHDQSSTYGRRPIHGSERNQEGEPEQEPPEWRDAVKRKEGKHGKTRHGSGHVDQIRLERREKVKFDTQNLADRHHQSSV